MVDTPDAKTIATLVEQFKLPIEKTVKTLMVHAAEGGLIALLVRGDHELNEVKAENLPQVESPADHGQRRRNSCRRGCRPWLVGSGRFRNADYH
ncbi:hypothetical protein HAALTHF_40620n [Vreelandella aquamarina]|nr:hypothetical protein HAALTHF_40620n [Halomonas axialensis]